MQIGILLIVVAVIGGGIFWYMSNQNEEQPEKKTSKPPRSNYNQKSEYSSLMAQQPKKVVNLTERKKIEGEIASDTVTLIAKSRSGRDEFFGWIDIIDGHHAVSPESRDYEKIQS